MEATQRKRRRKRRVLREPSSAAGLALIVSAVAQVVQQGAEAVAGSGGEIKAAIPAVITGILGALAVWFPEGAKDD